MATPTQSGTTPRNVSPSLNKDIKRVITRHDKDYQMVMALIDLCSGVDAIIAANKESFEYLDTKESSRLSAKGRKMLKSLKKSSIDGCGTIAHKLASIMKITGRKTYAEWGLNVNRAAAAHEDENNRFLYETEGMVILEELTSQDKAENFIGEVQYDDVMKKESNLKVVPIKRSKRIKSIVDKKIVKNGIKFPYYEDVAGRYGGAGYRIIYVCASKTYKLPLPKQFVKVYCTSEALKELRQ